MSINIIEKRDLMELRKEEKFSPVEREKRRLERLKLQVNNWGKYDDEDPEWDNGEYYEHAEFLRQVEEIMEHLKDDDEDGTFCRKWGNSMTIGDRDYNVANRLVDTFSIFGYECSFETHEKDVLEACESWSDCECEGEGHTYTRVTHTLKIE